MRSTPRSNLASVHAAGDRGRHFVANRLLLLAMVGGIAVAARLFSTSLSGGVVLCPLHGLLGMPCPGCGLTRAFCCLAHGQFATAAGYNPLCFLVAGLGVAGAAISIAELFLRRRLTWYGFFFNGKLARALAAGVITFTLVRIAMLACSGELFSAYIRTSWTYRLLAGS